MIIARAGANKAQLLILGLSRQNVSRLTSGELIMLKRETHGAGIPEGWNIAIIFGESEQHIFEECKKSGLVGPETKIHKDPRL